MEEGLVMGLPFYFGFAVCFFSCFVRSAAHMLEYKKRIKLEKRHYKWIGLLAFIYWFSWFFMVFNDPFRMNLNEWLAYAGLTLFFIGTFLVILSHTKIKGFNDKGYIRASGVYSKIRHPMYLGFSLWVIGLPIFFQSYITLLSAPIWIIHMFFWAKMEERELERKYQNYREYKKKTWF